MRNLYKPSTDKERRSARLAIIAELVGVAVVLGVAVFFSGLIYEAYNRNASIEQIEGAE